MHKLIMDAEVEEAIIMDIAVDIIITAALIMAAAAMPGAVITVEAPVTVVTLWLRELIAHR